MLLQKEGTVLEKRSQQSAPGAYERGLQIGYGDQLIHKVDQFDVVFLWEVQATYSDIAGGGKEYHLKSNLSLVWSNSNHLRRCVILVDVYW